MSDETTPETPETGTPESGTPATETPASDAPTEPVATPADSVSSTSADRRGVFVPRWLAILLGLVVAVGLVGGGGFWLGRETGDNEGHGDRRESSQQTDEPREIPSAPQTPNRPSLPDLPQAPPGRQLLGVAVEQADNGAGVVRVASGSPASDAGLEVGDVITEIDGQAVDGPTALVAAIRSHQAGDEISVTYERNGQATTVKVTLADVSTDGGSAS